MFIGTVLIISYHGQLKSQSARHFPRIGAMACIIQTYVIVPSKIFGIMI